MCGRDEMHLMLSFEPFGLWLYYLEFFFFLGSCDFSGFSSLLARLAAALALLEGELWW